MKVDDANWFEILAHSFDYSPDGLVQQMREFRSLRGKGPQNQTIARWADADIASRPQRQSVAFLRDFAESMVGLDLLDQKTLLKEVQTYMETIAASSRPTLHAEHQHAALSNDMNVLYRHLLGADPKKVANPDGREGFHLILRPRFGDDAIYQELMYLGPTAASPSFIVTTKRRVLIGHMIFDTAGRGHGVYGAPYAGEDGFSFRTHTMVFAERTANKPTSGLMSRLTGNDGKMTSSRVIYWRLKDQLPWLRQALMSNPVLPSENEAVNSGVPEMIDSLITEYGKGHAVFERLREILPRPDMAPGIRNIARAWDGSGEDRPLDELIQTYSGGPDNETS
ncbi:hypothetical protein [Pyruvatibacter mobilis]|uniref:hypothetical protein n=1 Tax=Pyruvatibacter mobilis TaxID=1712261 RepID=UPI003C7DC689